MSQSGSEVFVLQHLIIPVVMSGGVGSRLWPLSRRSKPKQLQSLTSKVTMLQDTLARAAGASADIEFGAPILVANQRHCSVIEAQLDELGVGEYSLVLEPEGRNTAPVVAIAADLANARPDALILVLPADHHIKDVETFRAAICDGAKLAQDGKLVTFGVQPTGPETGFGYIRAGADLGTGFEVDAFVEKPNEETAQRYLNEGNYFWNAGIFLFRADTVLREMDTCCRALSEAARSALHAADRKGQTLHLDADLFAACPSDSFDYAVMEKTDHAAVVPIDVGWSDVGAWNALWEMAEKDDHGNACVGDVTLIDGENLYVRGDGIRVATVGVSDLIVVATADAVLVLPRDRAQDVKLIVDQLAKEGLDELL
jgi:mannose-1-phosphate guanylyltransferase/mannose-6-phosphate isomerase